MKALNIIKQGTIALSLIAVVSCQPAVASEVKKSLCHSKPYVYEVLRGTTNSIANLLGVWSDDVTGYDQEIRTVLINTKTKAVICEMMAKVKIKAFDKDHTIKGKISYHLDPKGFYTWEAINLEQKVRIWHNTRLIKDLMNTSK